MRINHKLFAYLFSVVFVVLSGIHLSYGQEDPPEEKMAEYEAEVRQMVSFLEFSMNVLGDPRVTPKEKDIIINESYLKVFKDEEVQVEDDLDENRDVVTNKDAQAYLKDVDFFFKQVKFEFNVIDVSNDINHEGNLFFTVKMMRSLNGITVEDDSVSSDKERYIEVNVDEENKDLRIASIYTTKLSRNEELTLWWAGLAEEWRILLGLDIEVKEGLRLSEIQEFSESSYMVDYQEIRDSINIIDFVKIVAGKEEINLSGSSIITDLKPLDQLKNLKNLDISSSAILDLFPIRNTTTIEFLNCSNTQVEDLKPLKYSKSLRELYINSTPVTSIEAIENFENLEILHLEQTVIDSLPSMDKLVNLKELKLASTNLERLDSLRHLRSLVSLNFSNTAIEDLEPISNLKNLKSLTLNHTNVKSLTSLRNVASLEEITFENSEVDDLTALKELENLKSISADHSKIDLNDFMDFARGRPDVDVLFITDDLLAFWEGLDKVWVDIIGPKIQFRDTLSAVCAHKILKIKELDIHKNTRVKDLSPLRYMPLLEELNFEGTKISDLGPVEKTNNLKVLIGANSNVVDLSPIKRLTNLEKINFDHTNVEDISPISGLTRLDTLFFDETKVKNLNPLNTLNGFNIAYFDHTQVTDEDVYGLDFHEDSSIVVYKSDKLRAWWGNMGDQWQDIFINLNHLSRRPSDEELHKLASKKVLDVNSTSLKNLDPIPEMTRLVSLSFTDSRITSLYPLISLKNIKELKCPRNPISDIKALSSLERLQVLDLDNTQIEDLKPIRELSGLRELKFSGTNVKDISPLAGMENLEILEFSKTKVKQVKPLFKLSNLRVLKCYNNKISSKRIEDFKERNPDCDVVFY